MSPRRTLCALAAAILLTGAALAPPARAQSAFRAGLTSSIHNVVDLIDMAVDVRPRSDVRHLHNALNQLLHVLEKQGHGSNSHFGKGMNVQGGHKNVGNAGLVNAGNRANNVVNNSALNNRSSAVSNNVGNLLANNRLANNKSLNNGAANNKLANNLTNNKLANNLTNNKLANNLANNKLAGNNAAKIGDTRNAAAPRNLAPANNASGKNLVNTRNVLPANNYLNSKAGNVNASKNTVTGNAKNAGNNVMNGCNCKYGPGSGKTAGNIGTGLKMPANNLGKNKGPGGNVTNSHVVATNRGVGAMPGKCCKGSIAKSGPTANVKTSLGAHNCGNAKNQTAPLNNAAIRNAGNAKLGSPVGNAKNGAIANAKNGQAPIGNQAKNVGNLSKSFPNLGNAKVLDASGRNYNCISATLGIHNQWINPKTGPANAPLAPMDKLYASQGFQRLPNLDLRPDGKNQKVALYATKNANGSVKQVTHAALQQPNGTWTSKLGQLPLIQHKSAYSVAGPMYGSPVAAYARPMAGATVGNRAMMPNGARKR